MAHRTDKVSDRSGLPRLIDALRNHEGSRQGIGLLLVAVCAWFTEPGHDRLLIGFALAVLGELFRVYAAGSIFKNKELATGGAYSLVRHPLYVGNILILGGFTLDQITQVVRLLIPTLGRLEFKPIELVAAIVRFLIAPPGLSLLPASN